MFVGSVDEEGQIDPQHHTIRAGRRSGVLTVRPMLSGAVPDGNGTPFCEALVNAIRPRCEALEKSIYFNHILKWFPTKSMRGATSSPWSNALCDLKRMVLIIHLDTRVFQVHQWLSNANANGDLPHFGQLKAKLRDHFWRSKGALLKHEVDDHALSCLIICIYSNIGQS